MRILYGPSVPVMGKIIYNRKFNDNEEGGGRTGETIPSIMVTKNMVSCTRNLG